jgi:hypothetical protein
MFSVVFKFEESKRVQNSTKTWQHDCADVVWSHFSSFKKR